jgi:hypothetical protein
MFKPISFDLEETSKLFGQKRVLELRGLSNRLIREAAIENNFGKAELGVIAYALHKIETKQHFLNNKKWHQVKVSISTSLNSALFAARNNNSTQLIEKLKDIIKSIVRIDAQLGNYAQGIYEKAKTKQASLAYSYGLSLAQAAELTGADKKELQSYIGFTKMIDEEEEQKSIIERVDELRNLVEGRA